MRKHRPRWTIVRLPPALRRSSISPRRCGWRSVLREAMRVSGSARMPELGGAVSSDGPVSSARLAQAPLAQLHRVRDRVRVLVGADARRLQHAGQRLEARLGEPHLAALVTELARAGDRVTVDIGLEGALGVIEVQRAE